MKKAFAVSLLITSATYTSSAQAFIGCQGLVSELQLRADGTVEANWGWGWRYICNISADTAAPTTIVKKDACAGLYSMFLTARSTSQFITSYHSNSTTCAQALSSGSNEMPGEQPYCYVSPNWLNRTELDPNGPLASPSAFVSAQPAQEML